MGARRVITLRHIYVCARDTDKVKGADPEIEEVAEEGGLLAWYPAAIFFFWAQFSREYGGP